MFFVSILLFIIFILINSINGEQIPVHSVHEGCTIKYESRLLNEGDKIMEHGKLYKVENCQLQRAYQTCGTHLWFMINIVCGAIEKQKPPTNNYRDRLRRYARRPLLTEACCENSCTVFQMTRFCP